MKKFSLKVLAAVAAAMLLAVGLAWAAGTDNPVVKLDPADSEAVVIAKAVLVRPSARQLAWQELEYAGFVHFGMNTFTGKEWGNGAESPATFNPTAFDADQWARAAKQAGMKMLIVTAKHHDGFCLWPSAYTEHSVKHSPWRGGHGDVVGEVAAACRREGIKFGVYLSPWDRHEKTYGTAAYNDYYKNQLRELLTNYGEVSDVWMDGAGTGEAHERMVALYDWAGFFALIRELAPHATISIGGPDVRWVGNESGLGRETEWSVLPASGIGRDATAKDLGSRAILMAAAARGDSLSWQPAQVDVSIRPGWFYHRWQDRMIKSVPKLFDIYLQSVGRNSQLLLNLPPDRRGLIPEWDAAQVRQLREYLDRAFADDLARGAAASASATRGNDPAFGPAQAVDGNPQSYWMTDDGEEKAFLELRFSGARTFNLAVLQENLEQGQRIEEFELSAGDDAGWRTFARGTTVGSKRILRFPPVRADRVRVRIVRSRVCPTLAVVSLYDAPSGP